MPTIGYLRSALTHNLAEVIRHEEAGYYEGYPIAPGMVQVDWSPPRFLGYAKTDAEARRILGQVKRAELRLLYRLSSNCRVKKARLNHSPNGPSLLWPEDPGPCPSKP